MKHLSAGKKSREARSRSGPAHRPTCRRRVRRSRSSSLVRTRSPSRRAYPSRHSTETSRRSRSRGALALVPRRRTPSNSPPRPAPLRSTPPSPPMLRRRVGTPHDGVPRTGRQEGLDRSVIEQDIKAHLKANSVRTYNTEFEGNLARCDYITHELLQDLVALAQQDGNRDRLIWISNSQRDYEIQKLTGIRIQVFIRGHIRSSTATKSPKYMQDWRRTTWTCPRRGDANGDP